MKRGSIVNVSSTSSILADSGTLAYGCSKASLSHATKIMATELGSFNIRVNAVAPAKVNTDMGKMMSDKSIKILNSRSSISGEISAGDVADLIYYICTDGARFISGQVIRLDKGMPFKYQSKLEKYFWNVKMKNNVKIIAEIGVNHNGDKHLARDMIDIACEAGVDIVKFQTSIPNLVTSIFAPKAEYQKRLTNSNENMLTMCEKSNLSFEDTIELKSYTETKKIEFLSTPFDLVSIDFLNKLDLKCF